MAASEVVADLQAEMKVFKEFKDSGEIVRMAKMSGKLKKFGVSTTAMGSIYQGLFKGIGMGSEEVDTTVKTLYKMGKESGMTQRETFESFAKVLPTYARFGRQAPQMFGRLAATARKTNIKVDELMALTEDLDTSENALKTAAKLNSLLGGGFVNGVALLAADAAGKVKIIAEAYQRAEAQFGVPHQRVKRAMAKYIGSAGIGAENFQKIVRGQMQNLDKEMSEHEGPATDDEINTDVGKTLGQAARIDAAMAELAQRMNKVIYTHMPAITRAASFMADNAEIVGPLLLAAGAMASAAHLKSEIDSTVRIPMLKTRIEMLKAENTALKVASSGKGAAGCLQTIGRTVTSRAGTQVVGEVAEAGLKSTAGSAVGAVAKEGGKGWLARNAARIGGALKDSRILKTISKYPIIEFLFAFAEMAMIMSREDLDLKAKSRAVVEALTGAIGGWLGQLGGRVLGNMLNAVLPGIGVIAGFFLGMAGAFLGSYFGRMLGASDVGKGFADAAVLPLLKSMGFKDGKNAGLDGGKLPSSVARNMSSKQRDRVEGKFVAEDKTMDLLGVQDSPTAMRPVPIRKEKYESSKDDGVLLESLDNLRKGLIK
jgi:hypothetical protein